MGDEAGAPARCWYTLDAAAQPVGPYSVEDLAGYASSGLLAESQVFWREGKSTWDKLADVPELRPALEALQKRAADGGAAAAAPAGAALQRRAALNAAAAARAAAGAADPTDPLEAFRSEIAAVEADGGGGGSDAAAADGGQGAAGEAEAGDGPDAAGAGGGGGRASTPDELEFEDDDGTWYRWDPALRKYVPADAASVQQQGQQGQQPEYDVEAMTFVQEEEVIPTLAAARAAEEEAAAPAARGAGGDRKRGGGGAEAKQPTGKRAKGGAGAGAEAALPANGGAQQQQQEEEQKPGWFELKVNTSVYVTGLPEDTDADEVAAAFAKCGIVKLDEDGRPRVKLYRDKATGLPKGDGLVTYLKEPSVALACQILDGTPLRPGGPDMAVAAARFEMRGEQYEQRRAGADGKGGGGKGGKGGKGGGKGGGRKRPQSQQDKLERKLGWGGFDDVLPPEKVTVVLRHMFTPEEAAAGGASFTEELQADVLAECAKLGAVEKVRVHAAHPQGIVTVKFKQEEPAQNCVAKMDRRFFGGRQLAAHTWDGVTSYHVKAEKRETEEEEAARLEAFSRELEQRAAAAAAAEAAAAAPAAGGGGGAPEQ